MALVWNRTVDWDEGDWRQLAACRHTEPDLFFPIGTTGPAIDQIEAAKRVCRGCDAVEPCLDFALATNQESGVWGGDLRGGAAQAAQGVAGRPPPRLLTPGPTRRPPVATLGAPPTHRRGRRWRRRPHGTAGVDR